MDTSLPTALTHELSALLGDAWHTDLPTRQAHGDDNSRRHALPDAVAMPRDRQQVAAVVRACRKHRIPVVARGAGTGTTGAAVPTAGGVVLSFAAMNRILEIRAEDRYAVVEPGVLNGDLQRALAGHGLFWPPDPASADTCTIGGNLACNAGGPQAVKYGATRDNVLALTAVTGSGELIHCGSRTTKDATGYDLTHLLVGSEGTLALIVEATLKLAPRPRHRASLRALYADVGSAAAAVARVMSQPVTPAMLEFMDRACIRLAREVGGADIGDAGALLMVEVDGDQAILPHSLSAVGAALRGEGLLSLEAAPDEASRDALWAARRALSPALRTLAPGKINEDVVVPVSAIPLLVAGVEALAREFDLPIVAFGHAGNGNLHVNIMYDPADPAQDARAKAALPRVFALTLALGGTLSGEHGIGLAKRDFMADAFDPATLAAMRAIKAALDPDGILNPGKVLP